MTARALAMQNIDTDHGPGARRDPMCLMLRHEFGSERRAMQIELAKTVAARPATAFSILANVVGGPAEAFRYRVPRGAGDEHLREAW